MTPFAKALAITSAVVGTIALGHTIGPADTAAILIGGPQIAGVLYFFLSPMFSFHKKG